MVSEDPAVALLHITVTAGGHIQCKGLGLDPVHAGLVLAELDEVRAQLAAYLDKSAPTNVIPLRRIA